MTQGRAVAAALVTVYLLWGSTYFAIRLMVETAPPLLANGARYALAGLIITVYVATRRRRALRLRRRQLVGCVVVGTVLLLGGNSMIVVAEQSVASAVAAVLFAAVPLWIVLLRRAHGDSVAAKTLAGVAVGFVGVALIAAPADDGVGGGGAALLVLGSLSWAAGSFYASRLPLPPDTLVATGIEMLLGGIVTAAVGVAVGESPAALAHLSLRSWGGFVFLVVGGAILGFSAYRWLLDNAPVSTVATHAYVNPLVAVALGMLILDERLSWAVVAGGALVLAAAALCVSERGGGRQATSDVACEGDTGIEPCTCPALSPRS